MVRFCTLTIVYFLTRCEFQCTEWNVSRNAQKGDYLAPSLARYAWFASNMYFSVMSKDLDGRRKTGSKSIQWISVFVQLYNTALLRIVDDILASADEGELTALVLFDFSKGSDTIYHDTLLGILKYRFL